MADNNWIGGASVATQIETFTLNNDFNDAETLVTMTITAEDTSTEVVSITPTGVDESAIATAWQTELDSKSAATHPLTAAVTWTVAANVVTGTAKVSGKPFYAASSVTGGAGTITDSITTANSGPVDAGTAANYSAGTVVASAEEFRIVPNPTDGKSYNITYGLDQSAKDVNSFRRSPEYKGTIGDPANSFYLLIDVSNVGGANVPYVNLYGTVGETWLSGTLDEVRVYETSQSRKAVNLGGTIPILRIKGAGIAGRVNVQNGAAMTTFYCLSASRAEYDIGTSVTGFTTAFIDSGNGKIQSAITTINTAWQAILRHTAGAVGAWNNYNGAHVFYNGSGTLTQGDNYGGVFDTTENVSAAVTVTAFTVHAGLLQDLSAMGNVSWPTIQNPGGIVNIGEGAAIVKS